MKLPKIKKPENWPGFEKFYILAQKNTAFGSFFEANVHIYGNMIEFFLHKIFKKPEIQAKTFFKKPEFRQLPEEFHP